MYLELSITLNLSLPRLKKMNRYKEFQFAWWSVWVFGFMVLMNVSMYLSGAGTRPMTFIGVLIFMSIIIVVFSLFYGMTTKIDSEKINITFGVGLIQKNIAVAKIKSVKTAKSSWLSGWGIRFIRNGMLYNISGLNCVELSFHDTDRIIKIGTKDSAHLKTEIEKYIRP